MYDEDLANRIRELVAQVPGISERKMFGGLCFTVNGNMALGPVNDVCVVRVGPHVYDDILEGGVAREMGFTGRPMRGMVEVDAEALSDDNALADWVRKGVEFASSLPPKKGK